jgi:Ser/Thr protein kinase RdoA (MazF antagonist)
MEQRIKDLYNEEILQETMRHFGIGKDEIRVLDSFESYIYEFKNDSGEYILRISHSIRRSKDLIHGELDWINYLADHGISVARAVLSKMAIWWKQFRIKKVGNSWQLRF